ncbi:hypothetical protein BD414DRAFT_314084 [Trametes punicea]|nr:hypothetical protein BD414DRAFT_314084 [Trametes punicea]
MHLSLSSLNHPDSVYSCNPVLSHLPSPHPSAHIIHPPVAISTGYGPDGSHTFTTSTFHVPHSQCNVPFYAHVHPRGRAPRPPCVVRRAADHARVLSVTSTSPTMTTTTSVSSSRALVLRVPSSAQLLRVRASPRRKDRTPGFCLSKIIAHHVPTSTTRARSLSILSETPPRRALRVLIKSRVWLPCAPPNPRSSCAQRWCSFLSGSARPARFFGCPFSPNPGVTTRTCMHPSSLLVSRFSFLLPPITYLTHRPSSSRTHAFRSRCCCLCIACSFSWYLRPCRPAGFALPPSASVEVALGR